MSGDIEAEHHELVTLDDLQAYPKNTRKIRDKAAAGLKRSLEKFGDIAGITWNKRSGCLVCGHQRLAQLKKLGVRLVHEETGPVLRAENGERFAVRVVDWDAQTELEANITANNPEIAGEYTEDLAGVLIEAQTGALGTDFDELRLCDLIETSPKVGGDQSAALNEIFSIVVECETEDEQKKLIEEFIERKISCRAISY